MTNSCPQCNRPLRANAKFCSACGAVIGNTPAQSLQAGQILEGTYRIQRSLAKGGMGAIYLAEDTKAFNRLRVVKEMLDYFDVNDAQAVANAQHRFEDEARTLAQLRHPGIPDILSYFSAGSRHYIVMEYVDGQNLEVLLSQKLPQEEILKYGIQVCEILEYLGSLTPPVIHHDIKPANVVIEKASNRARLVDFGTAKARMTVQSGGKVGLQKSSIYGTEGYAPPEQYKGQSEVRSDVYALAATLYHMFTGDDPGNHPFNFPQLTSLSSAIRTPLAQALNADPRQRLQAAALRRGLLAAINVPVAPLPAPASTSKTANTPSGHETYAVAVAKGVSDNLRPAFVNYLISRRSYRAADAEMLSLRRPSVIAKGLGHLAALQIQSELRQIGVDVAVITSSQTVGWRLSMTSGEEQILRNAGEWVVRDKRYPQDNRCNCYHCGHGWSTRAMSVDTLPNLCGRCNNEWYTFRLFQCAQCGHQFAHGNTSGDPLSLISECPACRSKEWHIRHQPRLTGVAPQQVEMRVVQGQKASVSVALRTSRNRSCNGRAASTTPWLSVATPVFQNTTQIVVIGDAAQLQPRTTHKGHIDLVTDIGALQVPVELYVEAPAQLGTSTQKIDFGVVDPTKNVERSLRILNLGEQKLAGKISAAPSWLHTDIHTFQNETTIRLFAVGSKFQQAASYQDALVIESNGGNQTIQISATVLPPTAHVTPVSLDMGLHPQGKWAASKLVVNNQGIGLIEGTIQCGEAWLQTSPQKFRGNRVGIKVTADTRGLQRNTTHTTSITLQTNGGTLSVPVTLRISKHKRIAHLFAHNRMVQTMLLFLFLSFCGIGYRTLSAVQSNGTAMRPMPTTVSLPAAIPSASPVFATPTATAAEPSVIVDLSTATLTPSPVQIATVQIAPAVGTAAARVGTSVPTPTEHAAPTRTPLPGVLPASSTPTVTASAMLTATSVMAVDPSTVTPTSTTTPAIPTNTPTVVPIPTALPATATDTPLVVPTSTATPVTPTATSRPTNTPVPPTIEPTSTNTPFVPTDTPVTAPVQNIPVNPACPSPQSVLTAPLPNQVLRGRFLVRGSAVHDRFKFYKLEMAVGADSQQGFSYLAGGQTPIENGVLAEWVTTTVPNGIYTLRLTVVAQDGNYPPPCQVAVQVRN